MHQSLCFYDCFMYKASNHASAMINKYFICFEKIYKLEEGEEG